MVCEYMVAKGWRGLRLVKRQYRKRKGYQPNHARPVTMSVFNQKKA
jgi:hypothetical protein